VADNIDTPCVRNARSLLLCAVAHALLGDAESSERLEQSADEFGMEGFGHVLATPRLRLALARGDLGQAERLLVDRADLQGWQRGWLLLATQATRLDALAALGRSDELEAWPHVRPNTYLEAFFLRARGVVREDDSLIEQAAVRFDAMYLAWHAAQTRALVD
jgi:hypothetical protein